MYAQTNLN